MSTLAVAAAALAVSVLAFVVAGVVAFRFRRTWRALRSLHNRFSTLEQTRGDARREINRCAVRVAELEHRAGVAPASVYQDLRKVRPVDAELDELDDAAAAAAEQRTPRLGDRVTCDRNEKLAGEVRVVDHAGRKVMVRWDNGAEQTKDWEGVRFVS
jgi:hypothetical protein